MSEYGNMAVVLSERLIFARMTPGLPVRPALAQAQQPFQVYHSLMPVKLLAAVQMITHSTANGCASVYQDGEDYLYKYTPSANVTVEVTLTGTLSYTGVFITDKCPNAGGVVCVASNTSSSGNPKICGAALTAGTTYYIMIDTDPAPSCTPFNITISSASSYTCALNYTASSIGFAPDLNAGTNIALPIDDRFSTSYIPIGFDFCFDGYQFNGLLVSSNGFLIFDPISCVSNLPSANAAPSAYSSWPI